MVLVPRNTIEHFTHPHHLLRKLEAETEYLCDGCKIVGRGMRFRCIEGCYFDLHEYCATCSSSLSTFMHPQHPLTLAVRPAQATHQVDRVCDMCRDPVEGMFYRCQGCEFDVHPLCTQLPEKLRHALDTRHHLQLRTSSSPSSCAVCGGQCTSWHYGCATCGISIHIECVLKPLAPAPPPVAHNLVPSYGPPPSSSSTERGIPGFGPARSHWPPQPPPPPPPPHAHYPHYHGFGYPYGSGVHYNYGPSPYNNMYYNHYNQTQPHGGVVANGGLGQKMFAILGQLTVGVLSNAIFGGLGGVDFSSFM